MNMVTDPLRIKRTDPGRPEVCNVCQLHRFFGSRLPPDPGRRADRADRLRRHQSPAGGSDHRVLPADAREAHGAGRRSGRGRARPGRRGGQGAANPGMRHWPRCAKRSASVHGEPEADDRWGHARAASVLASDGGCWASWSLARSTSPSCCCRWRSSPPGGLQPDHPDHRLPGLAAGLHHVADRRVPRGAAATEPRLAVVISYLLALVGLGLRDVRRRRRDHRRGLARSPPSSRRRRSGSRTRWPATRRRWGWIQAHLVELYPNGADAGRRRGRGDLRPGRGDRARHARDARVAGADPDPVALHAHGQRTDPPAGSLAPCRGSFRTRPPSWSSARAARSAASCAPR